MQEALLNEERIHSLYSLWRANKAPLYRGQSGVSSRLSSHLRSALGHTANSVSRRMALRADACVYAISEAGNVV